LSTLAETEGFKLDGQGLRRGRKIVAAKEEEDIYATLGLPFIPPELREGQGEIQRAQKRKLPKLVSDKDMRHFARPYRPVRWRRYAGRHGRGDA